MLPSCSCVMWPFLSRTSLSICSRALALLTHCHRVREELARVFTRFYATQPGVTSHVSRKGTAAPVVKLFFVKAFVLKALRRDTEALALIEQVTGPPVPVMSCMPVDNMKGWECSVQCANISSKYRSVYNAWKPPSDVAPTPPSAAAVAAAVTLPGSAIDDTMCKLRALQSRRLYFRRRLQESTRGALDADADSSGGLEHAKELKLILAELEKLNVEYDALLAASTGQSTGLK